MRRMVRILPAITKLGPPRILGGALLFSAALFCSCTDAERQRGSKAAIAPSEADGYGFSELRRLHENHDPKTWDQTEDIDQLRFGLLRTSEIFPTATISRQGTISRLEPAPRPEIGQVTADTPLGVLSLDDYLLQSPVDAVVVVHKGRIVYERYPHMRIRDRHLYWSVSKSFLGTIVGILEDDGRIEVRAPIERYIDELSTSEWKGTPVIDILDMASGMSGREADVPNPYSDPSTLHYQFEQRIGNWGTATGSTSDIYDFVAGLKRLKPSGQVFEYASVNSFVIGWLIEEVTGKPYPEVLSERIWQRIGAEADAGIVIDRESGASWSYGGVISTLRDLARYGLLFTPSWEVVSSEAVISAAHLTKIQTGGRPELLKNRAQEYPDQPAEWCTNASTYQWACIWPDGDFFKGGFLGQGLYISPSRDLVIAIFSTGSSSNNRTYCRALATSENFGG